MTFNPDDPEFLVLLNVAREDHSCIPVLLDWLEERMPLSEAIDLFPPEEKCFDLLIKSYIVWRWWEIDKYQVDNNITPSVQTPAHPQQ